MRLEDRYAKAARNKSLFREVNERIKEIAPAHETEIVCECVDLNQGACPWPSE
jgi:hypothetical protein